MLAEPNRTMCILGEADVNFHIAQEEQTAKFAIVDNLVEDVILGQPWLVTNKAVMDFDRSLLHFGNNIRRVAYWTVKSPIIPKMPEADLEQALIGIPEQAKGPIRELLCQNAALFSPNVPLGRTTCTSHEISLTSDKPIRSPHYKYSDEKKKIIQQSVKEMLEQDVIEPSDSPYSSPIVIVKKKDGKPRFCVDYRKINAITTDVASPLPHVSDTLKDLGEAKYFTTLDLKSGYWQVPMHNNSKQFTAFSVPDGGLFQFKVMPFGLKNAPASFQKMMSQEVLAGFLRDFAIAYLDDIIVYSKTLKEHLHHLSLVLERLQRFGLTCSLEKCSFVKTELVYLGHKVTSDGNAPQTRHLEALEAAQVPTNRKEVRSFLGICNWLREYIPQFAHVAAPLTDLLSTKKRWSWNAQAQAAFDQLKHILSQPLELKRPEPDLPFVLQTDASGVGLGAALYQETPLGSKRVISYASARLRPHEKRYHSNELECLAIVWAIKRYRPYLENQHFILRTDNKAMTWLQSMKDKNAKLLRWSLQLQEFNFTLQHVKGSDNQLPDALSRHPDPEECDLEEDNDRESPMSTPSDPDEEPSCAILEITSLATRVLQAQEDSDHMQRMINQWERVHHIPPQRRSHEDALYYSNFTVRDGHIYEIDGEGVKPLVPDEMVPYVLREYHDSEHSGHPGRDETLRAIRRKYFWDTMRRDVTRYVKQCAICIQHKKYIPRAKESQKPRKAERPWDIVSVDLMGPYPETRRKKKYILTVADVFSKWTEAYPLGSTDTKLLISTIEREVFPRFGYPRVLLTDNGPQFISRQWAAFCERNHIDHQLTPAYHPRGNPVERKNQELKVGLRLHLLNEDHHNWDLHIPKVLFTMRTRRNEATQQTPSEILYGENLARPGDWDLPRHPFNEDTAEARRIRLHQASTSQQHYNQSRYPEPEEPLYAPGQGVFVKTNPSSNQRAGVLGAFRPRWHGPYTIVRRSGAGTYIITDGQDEYSQHADRLRPAHDAPPQFDPFAIEEEESD